MKLMKRITTTFSANINSAVNRLENHEGIVKASIDQTRQSIAKTQAQYNNLIRQQDRLKAQLESTQKQAALWTERAARSASDDRDTALTCIARRNHFEQEQQRIKAAHQQQQELLREVSQHLDTLKTRLSEIQQRHQLMRSRHSLAKTNKSVIACEEDDDLDQIFERWEALVIENESNIELHGTTDSLDFELRKEENSALLEQQLDEILEQEKEKN